MGVNDLGLKKIKPISPSELLFGKKPKVRKTTKRRKKPTKRESISIKWKTDILKRQRNYCASKDCARNNNDKKMIVNINSNFDHKIPLALGGSHTLRNIQALCPNCHFIKTRADRKKISDFKKKQIIKEKIKKKTNRKKHRSSGLDPFNFKFS